MQENNSRLSSRRIQKEKKKLLAQTFMYIGIAIVVLVMFIFLILPGFFSLITKLFDSSTPFAPEDKIPPQVPIISAPVPATNSASLKITGFGEPKSDLIFVLNNRNMSPEKIKEDGSFEKEITLELGENVLRAYSIDEAKNESSVTKDYKISYDNAPPELANIEPANDSSFETKNNQNITIKGEVKDETEVKIYINKRLVLPKEGKFSYDLRLNEGENKIEIEAIDKALNTTKQELIYKFKL